MGISIELCLDVFNCSVEVGARSVHLIDERNARNAVFVHLAPDGFRLGLHARNRAEYGDCTVENAEGTLHFSGKVNVSGGVDEVYLVFNALVRTFFRRPVAADCGRRDGNAAFAFLFHPVGDSRAFVHFAYFVDNAAVKQDSLGAGRFAGVDVRRYTDVSRVFERLRPIGGIFWR